MLVSFGGPTRPCVAAMLAMTLALAACGGSESDHPSAVSAFDPALATSPAPQASRENADGMADDALNGIRLDAELKAPATKLPVVRPGAQAPVDADPDKGANRSPELAASALISTGFETGVALSAASGAGMGEQWLNGQDSGGTAFPAVLAGALPTDGNRVRAWTDNPAVTDVRPWLSAGIVSLTGADSLPTRALALQSRGSTGAHQRIALEYTKLAVEPAIYQRMRVKFDAGLLDRARSLGEDGFFFTFWEASGNDLRFRVKLVYRHPHGLVWEAKYEAVNAATAQRWIGQLNRHPVVLATPESPLGWHTVEIWLDRARQRFKVMIDGQVLADRSEGLMGVREAPIDTLRPAMVADTPIATLRVDHLEIHSLPLAEAP